MSNLITKYLHIMVCGEVHKPLSLINLCYRVRRSRKKKSNSGMHRILYLYRGLHTKKKCTVRKLAEYAPCYPCAGVFFGLVRGGRGGRR